MRFTPPSLLVLYVSRSTFAAIVTLVSAAPFRLAAVRRLGFSAERIRFRQRFGSPAKIQSQPAPLLP